MWEIVAVSLTKIIAEDAQAFVGCDYGEGFGLDPQALEERGPRVGC